MGQPDRLEGDAAEGFLAACLALAREVVWGPAHCEGALRALEAAYTERPLLPAPTLVLDLSALLQGERLLPVSPPGVPRVREALRAYEDHVLARLLSDRRWTRLSEAVLGAPKELRAAAVGMTAAQVLDRLGVAGGTAVSQAVVRRLFARVPQEVVEEGRAALFDPALADRLAAGLDALAKAARRRRELLTDAEVFLVENIAALKGLGPRVALAQLAEVAQAVEERLPARLRGRVFEDGEAPTALEEESAYPVGGFSALTTSGSMENLVTSELIYMDDAGAPRPDLFDVRFVENELLYYARDESVAIRRRRALVLVFDASLGGSRVLDAGERYQRLVWALGAAAALVRKLSSWMDSEALRFELKFAKQGAEAPLAEEAAVVALLLREYRERGQLEVREAESGPSAVREAREAYGGRARVMLFAAKMPAGLEGATRPDAVVDLGAPRPTVHWLDAEVQVAGAPLGSQEAWAAMAAQLLDGVLRRHRAARAR